MREENNRPAGGTDEAVEDIIVEKNIKKTESVRTGAQGETRHIPTDTDDADRTLDVNMGSSRFIKTGTTPFHSVRAEQSEQEPVTEISTFADRLTTKASASKIHTGYTGKLNTYDAAHAAGDRSEKMIRPDTAEDPADAAQPAAEETPAAAEEQPQTAEPATEAAHAYTREFSFDSMNAGTPQPSDEADAAAESGAETDDKTKIIGGAPAPAPAGSAKKVNTKSDLLREIADSAEEDVRRNPDQLMMDGFYDPEKEAEENERRRKEAEELEKQLSKSRAKLVSSFTFRGHPETKAPADEKFTGENRPEKALPGPLQKIADRFAHLPSVFTPVNSREYSDYNERKAVFTALMDARRNTLARMGLVGLLGLVLFLINMIAHFSAQKHGGAFTVLGGNPSVLLTLNLVFLALTCGMLFPELKSGVISALKIRPRADTALLLLLFSVLLQNVSAFFTVRQLQNEFLLMTPAAMFLCLPYLTAKLFYYDNTRHCFKSVAAKSDKTYLRKITDRQLTARLLCDSNTDDLNVVYAGKTRFISRFLSRSAEGAFDGMPAARTVFFTAVISLIVGILAWILKGGFIYATTALAMTQAIAFPVCGLLASGWMIAEENKRLSLKSSFILRYADAHDFSAVDNIAVDADELFRGTVTDCLTAKGVREKQARFVAAAVAKQAGGIIASTFANDIAQFNDKLPPSESTVYEDRLGLSAWVSGCKVLLGTRALLKNHNVTVPAEEKIASVLGQGELPLFLAMEGHFTAMFAVRYEPGANFSSGLSELVDRGTNLLITTTDANLTEPFAEHLLGLSVDCVRMIGSAAAQQFAEAKSARSDTEDAGVVFGESFQSLCRCAAAAIRMERTQKLSGTLCNFGAWAMLAVSLVLVATGAFAKLPSIVPVLLQIVWIALCFAAPFLSTKLGLKDKKASRGTQQYAQYPQQDDQQNAGYQPQDGQNAQYAQAEMQQNAGYQPQDGQNAQYAQAETQQYDGYQPQDGQNAQYAQAEMQQYAEYRQPAQQWEAPAAESAQDNDSFTMFETRDNAPAAEYEAYDDDFTAPKPRRPLFNFGKSAGGEKKTGKIGGFFSKLMSPPSFDDEEADDYEDDFEEIPEAPAPSPFRKRLRRAAPQPQPQPQEAPAAEAPVYAEVPGTDYRLPPMPNQNVSLFAHGEERYTVNKSARQIEDDYEERRSIEQQVRRTFTAPEPPAAPYYDLKKKEEPEPVTSGEFVPPREKVNFYDEGLFSRFEDDKIFAGLYDDNGNRRRD